MDHGDLLVNSVGWNIPLLNETLQYMVNHKLGYKLSRVFIAVVERHATVKGRLRTHPVPSNAVVIEELGERKGDDGRRDRARCV